MDFILTQGYRVVFEDLVLINDVACAYYPISRARKENLRTYIHGLTKSLLAVVQKESEDSETDQKERPSRLRGGTSVRSASSKKVAANIDNQSDETKVVVIREVIWEFIRSVVVPLTAEELSQYPFWAAKVILVASESHKFASFEETFRFWCSTLYDNIKNVNATNIFVGSNIPYLATAIVSNNEHVAAELKNYFAAAMSMIPNTLSQSSSYDLFGKAFKGNYSRKQQQPESSTSCSGSNDGNDVDRTYASVPSKIVNKLISVAVAQPMLVLSVEMLTNRTLAGMNWLNSTIRILRCKGHMGFVRGFRASLIFAALPPVYLCGLSETIIYRCINGYGRSMSDQSGGVLSVAQHMLEAEGSKSLLQYGYITALQIVPGFLAFVAARSVVWLAFGSTKHRMLILKRRKKTVISLWGIPNL